MLLADEQDVALPLSSQRRGRQMWNTSSHCMTGVRTQPELKARVETETREQLTLLLGRTTDQAL